MKTKDLIAEAISLPIEERAGLIDVLLQSLNPPTAENDDQWVYEAQRRLEALRSGNVKARLGGEVFAEIRRRFSQ